MILPKCFAGVFTLTWYVFTAGAAVAQESNPPEARPAAPRVETPDAPNILPRNTVTLYGLSAIKTLDGKLIGGTCFPMRITTGGGPPGITRVGFFETEVGAQGDQWKSAGWMAALTASQFLQFDPSAKQVAFEVGGRIDGPSAGGLMTVGVLAAVRGDEMRSDAAMTGTINPDGMIGPVGGIAYKIQGAANAGKTLVLIPAGMTVEYDPSTEQTVDLIEHGRQLGVEVKPVGDLFTAYRELTSQDLPQPEEAEIPRAKTEIRSRVLDKVKLWRRRWEQAASDYEEIADEAADEYAENLIKQSKACAEDAALLLREGKNAAAWGDMVDAAVCAYLAMEETRCNKQYLQHGQSSTVQRLHRNAWLQSEIDKTGTALRFFEPKTLSQLSMYLMACHTFLEGVAYRELARQTLETLPSDEDDAELPILNAAGWQIVAWLDMKLTIDYLDMCATLSGKPIPPNLDLTELAAFYRRTAQANQSAFDSLVIAPMAKSHGIRADLEKILFRLSDEYYAVNSLSDTIILKVIEEYFPVRQQRDLMILAWQLYRHHRAAMLIAKYYSLDAQLDEDRNIVGLRRESAFNGWLDRSLELARRNIGALQRQGVDTSTFALIYEIAQFNSRRNFVDKLDSLESLFELNIHTMILRNLTKSDSENSDDRG